MTSPLIFHDIRKPACLASQRNGALDPAQLQPIRGGMLLKPAAGKWNEMRRAAFRDGVLLMPTSTSGTYRPLRVQNKFFLSRYEPCGDDQPGAVFWNNRHWSLKEGVALAAVPGTSNHGWGLSVDVRFISGGGVKDWLLDHATRFGFCWEYESEPWHLTYFAGDIKPPLWNARSFERAMPGAWSVAPHKSFIATGVAARTARYRRGNAVVLASKATQSAISLETLPTLPFPPVALITSSQKTALPAAVLDGGIPVYQVKDHRMVLRQLARFARSQMSGKVIGVTGSAGKTSTSKMLADALSYLGKRVQLQSRYGNLSGGIARALRTMPWDADFYVFEMAQGTMETSAPLVRPDIAIITNIGPGHLEDKGSPRDIARKKARIFQGVADDGTAVICRDSDFAEYLIEAARKRNLRVLTYGRYPDADVRLVHWDDAGKSAVARTPVGDLTFTMPVEGMHMAQNALACVAVAVALGIDAAALGESFSSFKAVKGRGATHELHYPDGRISLIDESYNANPLSMRAAIEASVTRFGRGGHHRRVLILGDMLELGKEEAEYHRALAELLSAHPPDALVLCGPLMAHLAAALAPCAAGIVEKFDSVAQASAWAMANLQNGDLVLVKSSNGTGLHQLVARLLKHFGPT